LAGGGRVLADLEIPMNTLLLLPLLSVDGRRECGREDK